MESESLINSVACFPVDKKPQGRLKKVCGNCRQAHMSCGSERPCTRCVSKGIECIDAESRKRGRKSRYENPSDSEDLHPVMPNIGYFFAETPQRNAPPERIASYPSPPLIETSTPNTTASPIPISSEYKSRPKRPLEADASPPNVPYQFSGVDPRTIAEGKFAHTASYATPRPIMDDVTKPVSLLGGEHTAVDSTGAYDWHPEQQQQEQQNQQEQQQTQCFIDPASDIPLGKKAPQTILQLFAPFPNQQLANPTAYQSTSSPVSQTPIPASGSFTERSPPSESPRDCISIGDTIIQPMGNRKVKIIIGNSLSPCSPVPISTVQTSTGFMMGQDSVVSLLTPSCPETHFSSQIPAVDYEREAKIKRLDEVNPGQIIYRMSHPRIDPASAISCLCIGLVNTLASLPDQMQGTDVEKQRKWLNYMFKDIDFYDLRGPLPMRVVPLYKVPETNRGRNFYQLLVQTPECAEEEREINMMASTMVSYSLVEQSQAFPMRQMATILCNIQEKLPHFTVPIFTLLLKFIEDGKYILRVAEFAPENLPNASLRKLLSEE